MAPTSAATKALDVPTPLEAEPSVHITLPELVEVKQRDSGAGPLQIGTHRDLLPEDQRDLGVRIEWERGAGTTLRGTFSVTSPGAASVRLGFRAHLGEGAEVWFYGPDGGSLHEVPITDADFYPPDGYPELLWSPVAEGDTITAQITLPDEQTLDGFWLEVEKVSHIHDPLPRPGALKRKDLGECPHLDQPVACWGPPLTPEGLFSSVAMITFEKEGGSYQCSGTMVIDRDDSTWIPYFLTARHCIDTAAAARSLVTWWFHQDADCFSDELHPDFERVVYGGATLLASSAGQDMSLLRLARKPHGQVWFWGWNPRHLNPWVPFGAHGVHHPGGRRKSLAHGVAVFDPRPELDLGLDNAITVQWVEGTTEGGASGSGLFLDEPDQPPNLVGVLSGGLACDRQDSAYGRFSDFFPRVRRWLYDAEPELHVHSLPFVPGADDAGTGLVRIHNASYRNGTVQITGFDETGQRFGPATLHMKALQSVQIQSMGLEQGHPEKGLASGIGNGMGAWRLEMETTLSVQAFSFIRTGDGFFAPMHHHVATQEKDGVDHVATLPILNPASNTSLRSWLRVANVGEEATLAFIDARDSRGIESDTAVLRLRSGAVQMVSAQELESGEGLYRGSLGDGTGKWQLYIRAGQPLQVMSLLTTRSGHMVNLSR